MDLSLSENAIRVLEARYLRRNPEGELVETPHEMFRRVAHAVAKGEAPFGDSRAVGRWEEEFFDALSSLEFLPNSPTLMNAGTSIGQLSACFVLPVEDSIEQIFDSLKLMALIQQSGGGTGFSFSHLRPKGGIVASTGGTASGPVSFMRIFDCATENIRQGGKRRGANMGVLRIDHPDILEFIDAKLDGVSFQNFNLSVGITNEFMTAAENGESFTLRDPRNGRATKSLPADELFSQIAFAAWRTGDPGLVFLDTINAANPIPSLGQIEATNPCGEVPLLPFEACNLGSINLSRMLSDQVESFEVDWEKVRRTTRLAVRFLDDVIEVGRWPSPRIESVVRSNRKIGLGIMGFAEMLIRLEIPYASERAVRLAGELSRLISQEALAASEELARERGTFPNWEQSVYGSRRIPVRNATRTSIAPTGTISIVAGTSASIEPLFALAYRHLHVLGGQTLIEMNPLFLQFAQQHGLNASELAKEIASRGSLANVCGIQPAIKQLFQTALEIAPEDHLRVQAAFQKDVDNAVSKTINLPEAASPESIESFYRQAWHMGLKGITVYRYGSKGQQVLELGSGETSSEREHFARCDPHACKI